MRRIPDSLFDGAHPASRTDEASLIWYASDPPPPPTPFLVRQPTLSFVRRGIKQLQAHGSHEGHVVHGGGVAVMGAGVHVMTELSGADDLYESVVVSVSPAVLSGLVGAAPSAEKTRVASAIVHERVLDLLSEPPAPEDVGLVAREAILIAAGDPSVHALLRAEASLWGNDDAQRIRTLMREHFHAPLALPDYAALAAMSLSTFKRRFREVFGEAPGRWLRTTRLQHARWLLLAENMPVTDACYASGFADLSNFIRAFRRHFGASPRAYRAANPNLVPAPWEAT